MVTVTFKDGAVADYDVTTGKWTSKERVLAEKLDFLTASALQRNERYIPDYDVFVGNVIQGFWEDSKVKVTSSVKAPPPGTLA